MSTGLNCNRSRSKKVHTKLQDWKFGRSFLADTHSTPTHSLTLDLKTSKANVINDEMTQLRSNTSNSHINYLISLLASAFVFTGCASSLEQNHTYSAATKCHEVRGAMDVGSGSTKIKIALVDTCEIKILKVLAEDQVAIAFKENIDASGNLNSKFIREASEKISALAENAVRNGVPPTNAKTRFAVLFLVIGFISNFSL